MTELFCAVLDDMKPLKPSPAAILCASCALSLSTEAGALSRLVARAWRPELCPHSDPLHAKLTSVADDRLPVGTLSQPSPRPAFHSPLGDIPAIFILPVELHISVFELVIDEENTAYIGFTPTFTIRRLMHVCRLWRSIATSTAVFWRYIDTTQPTPWVSLCLARSRACLLDVYIAFFPRQPAVGVDLVRPHARHIRSLAARIPSGCDGQGQYWKRLCPLFEAGMPQLQRLELLPLYTDSVFPRHQHAMVADYALSKTSLPRLRWLTAGMVVLPAPKDFWRSLRGLTLHNYLGPDANPRGFDELVGVLAQNPALEELHVRCFGERRFTTATSAHQQASASPLGPGMARLPCLRRISLYNHNDIVDFVPMLRSCLEVPKDVSTR